MKRASITVFLSFVILVLISFVYTSIEGARLVAASAETEYLTEMAKNSLGANYYFPLFKEYGLFSIDAGFETTEYQEEELVNLYNKYLKYVCEESEGNILKLNSAVGKLYSIGMLEKDIKSGFQVQTKELAIYEGLDLLLQEFVNSSVFSGVDEMGRVMKAQENAAVAVEEISDELLEVISIIDGVATTKKGLKIIGDKIGVVGEFVKMFGLHDAGYMMGTYGNPRIYAAVGPAIIYPEHVGRNVKHTIEAALDIKKQISELKDRINEVEEEISHLNTCFEIEEDEKNRFELGIQLQQLNAARNELILELKKKEIEYKAKVEEAESGYNLLKSILEKCIECSEKAISKLPKLKEAQEKATPPVVNYETTLNETANSSEEIKECFAEEIKEMRSYVGLENDVYNTSNIYRVLNNNAFMMKMIGMPAFDRDNLPLMLTYVEKVINVASAMSYDGVRFEYGNIVSSKNNGIDIGKSLKAFFGDGFLDLLGVQNPSVKEITGEDLVSDASYEKNSADLLAEFSSFMTFFTEHPVESILLATEGITSRFVSEVYLTNNFNCFSNHVKSTKIDYEREYVLYGNKNDRDNLVAYLTKLVACRAVFCFLAIMSNGARNAAATTLAYSIAGVTGIAPLIYVTKYLIMTVWAVEEAIVEAACLLSGKRVPVFSIEGNVYIDELLLINPAFVKTKVDAYPGILGANYSNYLTLISFFLINSHKNERMLDLIQENMRYRFRDSFRVKNMVTSTKIHVDTKLSEMFNLNFYLMRAYYNSYETEFSYE